MSTFPLIPSCAKMLGLLAVLSPYFPMRADISIQEKIPMADDWPEPVVLQTESPNAGNNPETSIPTKFFSQTIVPEEDMLLTALYVVYKQSEASEPDSYSVRIQEVPEGNTARSYAEGPDLLGSRGHAFGLAGTDGMQSILKLEFTGESRLVLRRGVTYAIEFHTQKSPMTLFRRGANTYDGGILYKNREVQIHREETRDLIMALSGIDYANTKSGATPLDQPIWPAKSWTEVGVVTASP